MKVAFFRYVLRSLLALVGLGAFGVCSAYFSMQQNLPFPDLDDERDARGFCVVIDAGHGGVDGGAQGNGLLEKTLTLDVAQRLRREMVKRGYRTKMTREGDDTLEAVVARLLSERGLILATAALCVGAGRS